MPSNSLASLSDIFSRKAIPLESKFVFFPENVDVLSHDTFICFHMICRHPLVSLDSTCVMRVPNLTFTTTDF